MAKVTIIGATGQVGSYVAHAVSQFPHVQEMCLYGRPGNEQYLDGLAHDMMDSFAARGTNTRVTFGTTPKELRGSDIIVLTSGIPRKATQTRLDLALENARIVKGYAEQIGRMAPEAILLVVTNPVDIMTTVGGIQIDNLMGVAKLPREEMIQRVKSSGSYIIQAKGATVYGPGDAIATLVRTIVEDENRMLTVSTQIRREVFGHEGVCVSVPARITRGGVFPIGVKLSEEEEKMFAKSVKLIRDTTENVCAVLDSESQE